MRKSRYSSDTVAEINGWQIRRERIGACTYWYAIKLDAEGYRVDCSKDLGSRHAAELFAAAN
jgi:hypothetical protein